MKYVELDPHLAADEFRVRNASTSSSVRPKPLSASPECTTLLLAVHEHIGTKTQCVRVATLRFGEDKVLSRGHSTELVFTDFHWLTLIVFHSSIIRKPMLEARLGVKLEAWRCPRPAKNSNPSSAAGVPT